MDKSVPAVSVLPNFLKLPDMISVNKGSWLGRSYKPKLKPAGPRIALYQHQMVRARACYTRNQPERAYFISIALFHILYYIYDSPTKFLFVPWLGF